MYNYKFGLEDRIDNLLALTEDMVFIKKHLDKRGKKFIKEKKKTYIIIESNGRSQKKGCQCVFTIKTLHFLFTILKICYYERKHINATKGLCHGNML
jgi:hypothetical protein